jgi:signal transduction histidine kinase
MHTLPLHPRPHPHTHALHDASNDRYRHGAGMTTGALHLHGVPSSKVAGDEDHVQLLDLLQFITSSVHDLLNASDFEAGINAWLKAIALRVGAARASFYENRRSSGELTLAVLAEWAQTGMSGNLICSFTKPHVINPNGDDYSLAKIHQGQYAEVHLRNITGAARDFMIAQGNESVLIMPVMVKGASWGAISFDFLTHQTFTQRYLAILQTAADTLASAISRNQEQDARIEAERERAQFAERQGELLAAVVSASELLLKSQNLEEVANDVVAKIGRALNADRCMIGIYLPPDEKSDWGYVDFEYEWVNAGIPRQTDQRILKVLDLSLYLDFIKALLRGEAIAIVTDEIEHSQARTEQEQTGAESQFVYPIMVDGKLWGFICTDDCHRPRVWSPTEIDSLRLVASALASVAKREQLTEARIEAERQRESARRAAQIAVIGERNRIARDIHDTLAQGFTGVIMQSQAAEDALQKQDAPATIHHLHRARHIAQTSLHDARRSVFALRPSVLIDQTLAQALAAQLARMLADSAALGSFEEHGDAGRPSNLVATELLRIAQEATTNVLRHAGATQIKIELRWAADALKLHIADNGKGFNVNQDHPGFGLVSMRERADRMQAELMIESDAEAGTKVCVAVDPQVGGVFLSSDDAAQIGKPE